MSCDSCPSCVTLERIRRCNGGGGGGGRSGNLIIAPPPVSKCSFSVGRSVVRSVGSPLSSVLRPSSVLSVSTPTKLIAIAGQTDADGRDRNVVRAASRTGGRRADERTDVWTFEESVRLMMCFREMMRIYSLCRNCISALLYFSLTVGEQISKL